MIDDDTLLEGLAAQRAARRAEDRARDRALLPRPSTEQVLLAIHDLAASRLCDDDASNDWREIERLSREAYRTLHDSEPPLVTSDDCPPTPRTT